MGTLFAVIGMLTSAVGIVSNYASPDPLYLVTFAALFGVNFGVFILSLGDD